MTAATDGAITHGLEIPETGTQITFSARDARRERTGVHATVAIMHGDVVLIWSTLNVERDEDRTRLCNAAHKNFPQIDRTALPVSHLKHAFDIFCLGLWQEHVAGLAGESMEGDPTIGPPRQILGPYVVQGGGTILYGPPGRGKSTIALTAAAALDAGCNGLWPVPEPHRILFVNLERSRDSMRWRLSRINRALGLDPKRPLLFVNVRGHALSEIVDGISRTIHDHKVDVLIVDSISRTGMGDLTEGWVANKIVDTLNALCPTWLALAHTPRADDTHLFGSIHFEAGEDIGVRLVSQTNERVTGIGLEVTKANDIAKPPLATYALIWGPDGLEGIRQGRRHEFTEIEAGQRVSLADELADYLAQGMASPTELAAALGRNRQAISAILNHDRRFVRVQQQGRVVYFGLKATDQDDTSLPEGATHATTR